MKVCYLITGLGLGGAETITVDIANGMVERAHQVSIIYLTGANEYAAIIDSKIEVVGVGMSKTPWGLISALWRVRGFIRKFRPDVVHSQMVHANLFARFLRVICPVKKLICTEHTNNVEGRFRLIAYRLTDFLSDLNTNVSEQSTQWLIKKKAFGSGKSITVYNGVDLSRFQGNDEARKDIRARYNLIGDQFVFLNVGRLTPPKDHKTLLKAVALVPNVKLLIVGDGPLRGEIEELIVALNLSKRVIMVGAQRNIPDFCSAVDCFVLSSSWEGFGIVLVEAMACGLPVITTDAGGCVEVVEQKQWITPTINPIKLADKMNQMIALSDEQRKAIGKQNRISVQRFDIENICNQWENIYKTLR